MTHFTSYLLFIIIFGANSDVLAVAVLSDKSQLESIKSTPVNEREAQLPNENTPMKFNPSVVEIVSDNYKKRDNTLAVKSEKLIEEDKNKITRTHGRFSERDKLNCCGNRFESSSGRLEPLQVTTRSSETNRYPDRYGNRPDDRFSWHSSSSGRPGTNSPTNNGVYGNSGGNTDRRFGLRPSYSNNDGEYGRPGNSNGNRPTGGRPGYGYGYGGYSDNGAYGSQGFEVNQRPGSIHFSGNGGRPSGGGYGVYGTVGEQDEFPGTENGGGGPISHSHNIHTQKAVALKALAGVALIGAAAALAANPALIPVSAVLAGRKRRSINETSHVNLLEFSENFIRNHVPKINEDDQVAKNFWDSSKCVARLTCEIQKEYVKAIRNDPILRWDIQRQLTELITSNIFSAEYVHGSMQKLTKLARNIKSKDGQCEIFTCKLFIP